MSKKINNQTTIGIHSVREYGGVQKLYVFVMYHCFHRDIEIFALFVSCLCHDLDHRGTNNSFQIISVSQVHLGVSWVGSKRIQVLKRPDDS